MAEEKPNPLASHLMNLVEGRQQAEVAKLALLGEISSTAGEILAEIRALRADLQEDRERARAR